jgi:sugar phosphate isomerase/epimerase/type 1 glutamine amidotransferase
MTKYIFGAVIATAILVSLTGSGARKLRAPQASAAVADIAADDNPLGWRLGVRAEAFPGLSFEEAVDRAAGLGLKYIAGSPDYRMDERGVSALRYQLSARDVELAEYHIGELPADPEGLTALFEFCSKFGVGTIVGEADAEALDRIGRFCAQYEVQFALRSDRFDPEAAMKLLEGRNGWIGLVAETGLWARAGLDPLATLRQVAGRVLTVHLQDFSEIGPGGLDLPLGQGVLGVAAFLREVYDLDLTPNLLSIGPVPQPDGLETSVGAYRAALAPIAAYHSAYIGRTRNVRRRAGVSGEEKSQIEAAVPATAPAAPRKPRRLLVYDASVGHGKHPSVPHANFAVTLMGEKTGAYEAVVTEDAAWFRADSLAAFDAVFFNNTVGDNFNDAELRQNLLDFVYRGGGLLGNHAASVAFATRPGWTMDFPEFSWMLGAFGANHRETDERAIMKIDDPASPLTAMFDPQGTEFIDEFFRFPELYTRENVRVLFSFDTDRTDLNQGRAYGECMRADNDYPVAWVKGYGAGRVYYTSIGHNPAMFWNRLFLEHFLAAIQFALGDLEAPVTASAKVDPAQLAAERLGWQLAVQFWSFNRFSFYESLEKAKSLGLSYAEVYSFSPTMGQPLSPERKDELFTHAMQVDLRRETRHAADRAGLRLLNAYIGDFGATEADMRRVYEWARDMGIATLVGEPEPAQWDALEKLCDEYGINLAIHHHHRENSRYWDPGYLAGLLKGRSPRLGACPDTGHWLRAGVDPVQGLRTLEGRILNVHLKDLNKKRRIEAHDVPWGTGKSDVRAILAELKRQNYKGGIVVEYEHNWENSLPEIEKSIAFFREAVIELVR